MARFTFLLSGALAGLAGCQTPPPSGPAVLASLEEPALETLRQTLATAVGRPNARLGMTDATSSVVSLLPPAPTVLEGNSPAMPVLFDLSFEGGACLAVLRDGDVRVRLPDGTCKTAQ